MADLVRSATPLNSKKDEKDGGNDLISDALSEIYSISSSDPGMHDFAKMIVDDDKKDQEEKAAKEEKAKKEAKDKEENLAKNAATAKEKENKKVETKKAVDKEIEIAAKKSEDLKILT